MTVAPGATAKLALRQRGFGSVAGTVVDAVSRAPVIGLRCWTRSKRADASWRYDNQVSGRAVTDAHGAYRVDHVIAGDGYVMCADGTSGASGEVRVVEGETTHKDLVASALEAGPRRNIGLELEDQLGAVMVKSVAPGSAADRAGLAVGDVLVQIGDDVVGRWGSASAALEIQYASPGTSLKLTIERADKQLIIQLPIEGAP